MELYEHLLQISQMWNNKTDVNKKQTQIQQHNSHETHRESSMVCRKTEKMRQQNKIKLL